MGERYDVIVVGAGIIGAMAAWRLAQQGHRVALVDAGPPGGQASNAAAGILAPSAEVDAPGAFWRLAHQSLSAYPEAVAALERDSGIQVDFHRSGVLQLAAAPGPEAAAALAERFRWQSALDPSLSWLDPQGVTELEPALDGLERPAIFAPNEAQVHAPKMVQAAVRAAVARGVELVAGTPVEAFLQDATGQVEGVVAGARRLQSRRGVVLAAGAWTGLLARQLELPLALEPVRGQVLGLHHDGPRLRRIVFWGSRYLCPKPDGRLIAGATEDAAGFDGRTTARGVLEIAEAVAQLGLPLDHLIFERAWAGLRPKLPDGWPVLGPVPGRESLFLASGHHRNGVLLSVITAAMVAAWAAGESLPQWAQFSPARLSAAPPEH
ncbi:MAG: glycine oxidase ThiO [Firmicutes bacterium]|nr:glycine oxidase ThiO [Alicyclobacillaceae bacterium]MCL6496188.1 glycine oxidase ThiO [Bacillota bacterium]